MKKSILIILLSFLFTIEPVYSTHIADNSIVKEDRIIVLSEEVTSSSVKSIIEKILALNAKDELQESKDKSYKRQSINLYINTSGGSVYYGLGLIDVIKNSKTEIITISTGHSMSMGFMILLSGHKRYATKHSTIMIHELTSASDAKLSQMKEDLHEMDRLQTEVLDSLIIENTHITKEILLQHRDKKQDWYVNPQQALDLGIIDKIL